MDTERDGMAAFVEALAAKGFAAVQGYGPMVAPPLLKANPLRSGDEDACALHFPNLAERSFLLYCFVRVSGTE